MKFRSTISKTSNKCKIIIYKQGSSLHDIIIDKAENNVKFSTAFEPRFIYMKVQITLFSSACPGEDQIKMTQKRDNSRTVIGRSMEKNDRICPA